VRSVLQSRSFRTTEAWRVLGSEHGGHQSLVQLDKTIMSGFDAGFRIEE